MELPFNEAGVSVTRTALSVAGQVIALRDIDDVQVVTRRRSRGVPVSLSAAGAVLGAAGYLYDSPAPFICGLMLFVVGILTWYSQDVTHQLIVVKGGERHEALTSLDRAFVERVEQVLRSAMAGRGDNAATRPVAS